MKSFIKASFITSILGVSIFLTSCGSTDNVAKQPDEATEQTAESKTANRLNVVDSVFNAYKDKVTGKSIKFTSIPKEIVLGKEFASPYEITVLNQDGSPASNFELTVLYPSNRTASVTECMFDEIVTNEKGVASFNPGKPDFTFNDVISVYPSGEISHPKIKKLAKDYTVTAPFKVSTNLKSAGGTLAIVDFTPTGKPITGNFATSSEMLKSLMIARFTKIGNAPIDIANQVLNGDEAKILRTSKSLLGSYSKFLIFGTVKHLEEPKTENGSTTVVLDANIKCMLLSDGTISFETHKTITETAKNEWDATAKARTALANTVSKELIYGM